jgi:hypothetical protein
VLGSCDADPGQLQPLIFRWRPAAPQQSACRRLGALKQQILSFNCIMARTMEFNGSGVLYRLQLGSDGCATMRRNANGSPKTSTLIQPVLLSQVLVGWKHVICAGLAFLVNYHATHVLANNRLLERCTAKHHPTPCHATSAKQRICM